MTNKKATKIHRVWLQVHMGGSLEINQQSITSYK